MHVHVAAQQSLDQTRSPRMQRLAPTGWIAPGSATGIAALLVAISQPAVAGNHQACDEASHIVFDAKRTTTKTQTVIRKVTQSVPCNGKPRRSLQKVGSIKGRPTATCPVGALIFGPASATVAVDDAPTSAPVASSELQATLQQEYAFLLGCHGDQGDYVLIKEGADFGTVAWRLFVNEKIVDTDPRYTPARAFR